MKSKSNDAIVTAPRRRVSIAVLAGLVATMTIAALLSACLHPPTAITSPADLRDATDSGALHDGAVPNGDATVNHDAAGDHNNGDEKRPTRTGYWACRPAIQLRLALTQPRLRSKRRPQPEFAVI